MIRITAFLVALTMLSVSIFALAQDDFAQRASDMLDTIYSSDEPGAAVVVSRDGEVLLERGFGLADVELNVGMDPDHVFRLASVTKQFAAAAMMALIEEGRVALDDPISKFLPEFPVGAVTVEQLLNHTSGIKSYTSIVGYMDSARIRADLDTDGLIAVFANEPVDFAPGERWAYNNSGYVLVGAVIEAVTETPWHTYLRDRLLVPNGIDRIDAYSDSAIVPGRVEGYAGPADDPERASFLSMTQPHAAGALMGTAADVDRWQQALHNGQLIGTEAYQQMITPRGAAADQNYGFGIGALEWFGQLALTHGGGINGFATHALYLPEEKLSVVVLSNRAGSGWRPGDVALRLAGLAIDHSYPIEQMPVEWTSDQLFDVQGTYRINDREVRTLRVEDGQLISQRNGGAEFTVYPISNDQLAFESSLSTFFIERNEAKETVAVALQNEWGHAPERAGKISDDVQTRLAVVVPAAQLERLVGRYELQPGFVLEVRVTDESLEVQATGQPAVGMQAESPTRFYNRQVGAIIEFDLPETGPASGLTLHQGGQAMPAPRMKVE